MLIFFLIFNMATDEIAAINAKMGSDKAAASTITEPIKEMPADLKIAISKDTLELWNQGRVTKLPILGQADFDWSPVTDFLKNARSNFPQKKDMIVQSQDAVLYGMVIKAMDYSMAEGFSELVVMGVE